MNSCTRRSVLRSLSASGLIVSAGCSGTLSDVTERSIEYALDDVYVENSNDSPVEFTLKIYEGDRVMYENAIRLDSLREGKADFRTIEKPWMDKKGRYGVEIETAEGKSVSLSLSEVLDRWDDSIHDYKYIEYTIISRSDDTFGVYPDFYNEARTK